jgi:hypothetical protein
MIVLIDAKEAYDHRRDSARWRQIFAEGLTVFMR